MRATALRMRDPVDAGRRCPIRDADEDVGGVAEPRRPGYGDSAARTAERLDANLFDRLGIPVPTAGGRREGLSEAVTRAAGERTRAFEAAGGVVGASLLHRPVEWEGASSGWERPDAWVLREPWVDWGRGGVTGSEDC